MEEFFNLLNFLNGTIHLQFLEFQGYEDENLKMVSQQYYRAWSECTYVQAGLAYNDGKD